MKKNLEVLNKVLKVILFPLYGSGPLHKSFSALFSCIISEPWPQISSRLLHTQFWTEGHGVKKNLYRIGDQGQNWRSPTKRVHRIRSVSVWWLRLNLPGKWKCSSCFCVGVKQHGSKSSRERDEKVNQYMWIQSILYKSTFNRSFYFHTRIN